jgi:magnesium transporter
MGAIRTRVYCEGRLEAEDFPLEEVSEQLARPNTVVWVDLLAPDEAQLCDLADELGLHELAVEDALSAHQRPKLDRYEDHLFLSSHAVGVNEDVVALDETEVDAFIHERWFITVRKNDGFDIDEVIARWDRSPKLAVHGVSFLLYGLLDVIVDGYFAAIQSFDEYYDDISDGLFNETPLDPSKQREWFNVRRATVRFHRLVIPLREVISSLMRRDTAAVSDELYPYFQDVYDHILRISESSDSLRDLVSTIVETNLSLRDYRQNQIVKKVSSWAAIALAPTLITGFYGMNVPYPGDGTHIGVLWSIGLMVVSAVGLYALFRSRDWL